MTGLKPSKDTVLLTSPRPKVTYVYVISRFYRNSVCSLSVAKHRKRAKHRKGAEHRTVDKLQTSCTSTSFVISSPYGYVNFKFEAICF